MKKILFTWAILFSGLGINLYGQDTLPEFTLKNVGNNRIIISWTNNYQKVKQISIQRSLDSLKNFKTILSVPDPMTHENGYADTKLVGGQIYYRLFIVLDQGIFFFSKTKKPQTDTSRKRDLSKVEKMNLVDSFSNPNNGISENKKRDLFIPSTHVYTHKDGYVRINLPEVKTKKYNIKFYNADGNFIFELKDITDNYMVLDKSVFYHAGWFSFELFEDGKLVEKNKLYLPKEF